MMPHCTYAVDEASGCWVWQGHLVSGYGVTTRNGRALKAHRWHYEQARGPVPDGLELDHLCRNRACVNPDHLEPVTRAENVRRGALAKLTREQVEAIRASDESQKALALRYGVHRNTIWHIRSGRCWGEAA